MLLQLSCFPYLRYHVFLLSILLSYIPVFFFNSVKQFRKPVSRNWNLKHVNYMDTKCLEPKGCMHFYIHGVIVEEVNDFLWKSGMYNLEMEKQINGNLLSKHNVREHWTMNKSTRQQAGPWSTYSEKVDLEEFPNMNIENGESCQ